MVDGEMDELFKEAAQIVTQYDRASASLLQRRLSIGYARAARLIDQLEAARVIGPADGARPRDVLIQSYEEFSANEGKQPTQEVGDPFDNIYFWIKVLKVSLLVFIPFWLFGFEAGMLVGIVIISLFLSKISLTLLEINEYLHQNPKEKTGKKVPSKLPR